MNENLNEIMHGKKLSPSINLIIASLTPEKPKHQHKIVQFENDRFVTFTERSVQKINNYTTKITNKRQLKVSCG